LGSARDAPTYSGYYPYGEEHGSAMSNGTDRFAAYFRDDISGLDYARNRYYSSALGRFMTADPYRASGGPADPGSWNRYAYVKGDPVNFNDPHGTYAAVADPGVDCTFTVDGIEYLCSSTDDNSGCLISEFDPAPHPSCDQQPVHMRPPPGPPKKPTPPQTCDVEMFTRPLNGVGGLFGTHQYLEVADDGVQWTIEGGPQYFKFGHWGKLRSYVDEFGEGLPGDDPTKDRLFGGILPVSCAQADTIIRDAQAFKTTADYHLDGPNSNSFMSWLLKTTGLSFYYPVPPPGSVGWGVPIPGNP
jgi:RHS repeat-associated protein